MMKQWIRAAIIAVSVLCATIVIGRTTSVHAGDGPGVLNVAAVWATTWGSEVCTLTLQQSGNQVTGGYVTSGAPPGGVQGTISGNVLTGTWSDSGGGYGGMRLVFSPDGRSFTGTWGSGGSVDDGGGWDGRR